MKPTNLFAGQALSPTGNSSFRNWAAERTKFPAEVAEMALAHCGSAKTVAAYNRSDLFERRSRLMSAWTTSPRPSRRRKKKCADVRGGLRVVVAVIDFAGPEVIRAEPATA